MNGMKSSRGWICLHRSLLVHELWDLKPFSKGQAWVDILLLANHERKEIILGNEVVSVEKGSFITSEMKLMERWGWSKTKVRAFLENLQKAEMINLQKDRKKTTVHVVNWRKYQNQQTMEKPISRQQFTLSTNPKSVTNNKGTSRQGKEEEGHDSSCFKSKYSDPLEMLLQ